jgi:hypothetical protein
VFFFFYLAAKMEDVKPPLMDGIDALLAVSGLLYLILYGWITGLN